MAPDRDALFSQEERSTDDILTEIDRLLAGIDGAPEADGDDSAFDFWEEETPAAFEKQPPAGQAEPVAPEPDDPVDEALLSLLGMEPGAAEAQAQEEPDTGAKKPDPEEPVLEKPVLDEEPALEGPALEEPALEEPVPEEPAAEGPFPMSEPSEEPELPPQLFPETGTEEAPEPSAPSSWERPLKAKKLPESQKKDAEAAPSQAQEATVAGVPRRRKKRKKYLNRWYLLLAVWLAGFFPELVLHIATATGPKTLYNPGLVMPLLFSGVPVLLLFALTLVIPNRRANHILLTVYSVLVLVFCASQLVYSRIFNNSFYSAYSLLNGGQVFEGQFNATIFSEIGKALPLILLMAVPVLLLALLAPRFFSFKPLKKRRFALLPAVLAVALQLLAVAILPVFGTGDHSAYDLYHNSTDPYAGVNLLGAVTSLRVDLTRLLTHYTPKGSIHLDNPTPSGTGGANASVPMGTVSANPVQTTTGAASQETGLNVLDFDFNSMASRIMDDDLRDMYLFFAQRTPSSKNDHTGMFKGCNLILICAEAFDELAVSPTRTPTLYKLMHEGIYFSNYYVSDWGTSTTDGEYAFLTGTVPEAGAWSFERSAKYGNAMPLTMSRQLLKQGYNAYAFHGHDYDYYSRNEYLENLGFVYKAHGQGLDVVYSWPESDIEVIDKTTGDYVNNEPFVTYYMTISGHREFNFSDNYICYKNRDLVADEPYSSNVRAYLACQLELEKSMELLMQRLEEAGVLENTVIVLTADHYPNGLTDAEMSELAGHEISDNFGRFRNGAFIYKAGMTPETVDAPSSHLDLLPTLSNLFGLDFDSRLYMGRDVFSDAEPFVMFRDRSWITDLACYNSNTGEVTNYTDTPVSEEYIQQKHNDLSNRFTVSTWILENDFWRQLFGDE